MINQIVFGTVTALHLLYFVAVITAALIVSWILNRYLHRNLKGRIGEDRFQVISKLLKYGILAVALLLSVPLLGMKLSGLAVAGGVFGVVIGFASQNVVSNFVAGVFVMIERPIRIENEVNIGGTEGYVEEIRILSTLIRTYGGLRVRIPNINVFTGTLINHEAFPIRRVDYTIGIRYSDDANQAMAIMRSVIEEESLALVHPEPNLYVSGLGSNSVDINVRFWAPVSEFWGVKFQVLQKLKLAIEAEGIQIPFPQRVIWQGEK